MNVARRFDGVCVKSPRMFIKPLYPETGLNISLAGRESSFCERSCFMAVAHAQTAIKKAVYRQVPSKRQALLDRLFAVWFARFVYNQNWEDPVVDLDALE